MSKSCSLISGIYRPPTQGCPSYGRLWGKSPLSRYNIWYGGTDYCIPKAVFHLLKGDYTLNPKSQTLHPISYLLNGDYALNPKS